MTGTCVDTISLAEDLVAALGIAAPCQPTTLLNVGPYDCLVELWAVIQTRGLKQYNLLLPIQESNLGNCF